MEKYQNINILYEDNHLLVVVKPQNIPVCPDSSKDKDLLSILKEYLKEKYGLDKAITLYGGSMKPSNCEALLSKPSIDGGLIGGACLKMEDFEQIIMTKVE